MVFMKWYHHGERGGGWRHDCFLWLSSVVVHTFAEATEFRAVLIVFFFTDYKMNTLIPFLVQVHIFVACNLFNIKQPVTSLNILFNSVICLQVLDSHAELYV